VPEQDRGNALLDPFAHLAGSEGTVGFHQHHPAGFGESRLSAAALTIYQFPQLFTQHFIAEHVGKSNYDLLHGAYALYHVGPLAHELVQLVVRRPDNFLHMRIGPAGKASDSAISAISHYLHDLNPPSTYRSSVLFIRRPVSAPSFQVLPIYSSTP
jgi:hypothetical protein